MGEPHKSKDPSLFNPANPRVSHVKEVSTDPILQIKIGTEVPKDVKEKLNSIHVKLQFRARARSWFSN